MSAKNPETPADLARQLAQHVDSLRAAGIEWAPTAPLPPPTSSSTLAPALVQTSLPVAPSPVPDDAEQRRQALSLLAGEVAKCMRCPQLASTRTQTVFGVGRIDPELCFVGEAPGFDEDRLGEPFVGAAGQLLTRII